MNNSERIHALYAAKKASRMHSKSKPISAPAPQYIPPVIVTKPLPVINIPGLQRPLFEYQKQGVAFIESRNGRALLGDEPGLGKTAQSLAYLQLHLEARPAIIVCPSSLKLNWAKEIFMWTEKREENLVYILSGKTKKYVEEVAIKGSGKLVLNLCKMPETGIFIVNYDIVADWLDVLKALKAEIILTDESHYLKTKGTARTKAIISLAKGIKKNIAMTGTLIENRPAEAYTVINMIDKQLFPSEWKFKNRYCDPKHNGFGWDFKGASNIPELHRMISNICIRRLKKDVLKDLPDKIRSVVPMELDNRAEYSKAEANLISWVKENKGLKKAEQASKVEALARINELGQLSAKGKLESCLNWIEDALSDGEKLVVFCTHKAMLNAIYDEFRDCAVKVDGSVTGEQRNNAVEQFQNNKRVKLFVGNVQAAGVGLTLTASSQVAFVELPWTPAGVSQASDRVHRIGQKDCVNVYFLLASNTMEIDIAELIDQKQKVVDGVLDGIESSASESILDGLLNFIGEE